MKTSEIQSVGHLNNRDGTVALTICVQNHIRPIYVDISEAELVAAGGNAGLNENKQRAVDFYNQYGPSRNR